MADVAISNGGVLSKNDLRFNNFSGSLSGTDRTLVSATVDKQIVLWKVGANGISDNTHARILEGGTEILGFPINNEGFGYIDFSDTPYVLPTNTLFAMDITGTGVTGTYWVIYSLIEPIDRT